MGEVFGFYGNIEYTIVLIGSLQLKGKIIETFDNGIMLEDGTRIPQDKILFFRPNLGTDEQQCDIIGLLITTGETTWIRTH